MMEKFVFVIVISDTDLLDLTFCAKSAFPEQFTDGTPSFPIEGRTIQGQSESHRKEVIGSFRILWERADDPTYRTILDGIAKGEIEKTDPKFLAPNYAYKWSVVEGQRGNKVWIIAVYEV